MAEVEGVDNGRNWDRFRPVGRQIVTHAGLRQARLVDVAEIVTGSTPSTHKTEYYGGTIPFVGPADLGSSIAISRSAKTLTDAGAAEARLLPTGTVLVCCIGATIGKVGYAGTSLATNQQINALVFDTRRVDSRYGFHFCKTLQPLMRARGASTTLPIMNKTDFGQLEIPLPPLPEQKRIAAILDKADAIRGKRQEAIRLTEELLKSAFLEMFGDPVTNPKRWEVKPLGEISAVFGGGTPSRLHPEHFEGTIPWATAKDFNSHFMSDAQEHVTEDAVKTSATRIVPPGTILVVVKSKILMRRLPVAITTLPLCFNQDVKGIVPHDPVDAVYMATHLRMAQSKMLELARGANTEGLTLAHLKSHAVMRPPSKLIATFSHLESGVRKTLGRESKGHQDAESLFASLATRAFSGGF